MPRKKAAEVDAANTLIANTMLERIKTDLSELKENSPERRKLQSVYDRVEAYSKTSAGLRILAAVETHSSEYAVGPQMGLLLKKTRGGLKAEDLHFIFDYYNSDLYRAGRMMILHAKMMEHPSADVELTKRFLNCENHTVARQVLASDKVTPEIVMDAIQSAPKGTLNSILLRTQKLTGPQIVTLMRSPNLNAEEKQMLLGNENTPQEVTDKVFHACIRGKGIRGLVASKDSEELLGNLRPSAAAIQEFVNENPEDPKKDWARLEKVPLGRQTVEDVFDVLARKMPLKPLGKLCYNLDVPDKTIADHADIILKRAYENLNTIPLDGNDFPEDYEVISMTSKALKGKINYNDYYEERLKEGKPLSPELYDLVMKKVARSPLVATDPEIKALLHPNADEESIKKATDFYDNVVSKLPEKELWGTHISGYAGLLVNHPKAPNEILDRIMSNPTMAKGIVGALERKSVKEDSKFYPYVEKMLSDSDSDVREGARAALDIPKESMLKYIDSPYEDMKAWVNEKLVQADTPEEAQQLSSLLQTRPEYQTKLDANSLLATFNSSNWKDDPDRFQELAREIGKARENGWEVPKFQYPISDEERKNRQAIVSSVIESGIEGKNFDFYKRLLHPNYSGIIKGKEDRIFDNFLPMGGTKANKFADAAKSKMAEDDYDYTPVPSRHANTAVTYLANHLSLLTPERKKWIFDNGFPELKQGLFTNKDIRPKLTAQDAEALIFGEDGPFAAANKEYAGWQSLIRCAAQIPGFDVNKVLDLTPKSVTTKDKFDKELFLNKMKSSVITGLMNRPGVTKEELKAVLDKHKGGPAFAVSYGLEGRFAQKIKDLEKVTPGAAEGTTGAPTACKSHDCNYTERSVFLENSSKLRKLRDAIMAKSPETHNLHAKEVAKIPGLNGDFSKFRDKHGLVNADMIQEYLDKAPPLVEYNVDHSTWGHDGWDRDVESKRGWGGYLGQQKHNNEQSKVFRINLTDKMEDQLKAAGVYDSFRKVMRHVESHHGCHPVNFKRTLGWVRWTGKPEEGIFIDEVQTDPFSDMHNMIGEGQLSEDHRKKINQILYGGKHANLATLEAFHQYWRNKGNIGMKIAMHDVSSKQTISLGSHTSVYWPDQITTDEKGMVTSIKPGKQMSPPPVHMQMTYGEMPPKNMGMEPSEYRKQNMPTQNNPWFQGRKMWQHNLRKDIADLSTVPGYLPWDQERKSSVANLKNRLNPTTWNSWHSSKMDAAIKDIGGLDANPNLAAFAWLARQSGAYDPRVSEAAKSVTFDMKQLNFLYAVLGGGFMTLFNKKNPSLNDPAVAFEFKKRLIDSDVYGGCESLSRGGFMDAQTLEYVNEKHPDNLTSLLESGYISAANLTPDTINAIWPKVGLGAKNQLAIGSTMPGLKNQVLKQSIKTLTDYHTAIKNNTLTPALQKDYNYARNVVRSSSAYDPAPEDTDAILADPNIAKTWLSTRSNINAFAKVNPAKFNEVVSKAYDSLSSTPDDGFFYELARAPEALKAIEAPLREKILMGNGPESLQNTLAYNLTQGPITDEIYRLARKSQSSSVRTALWGMPGWMPEELLEGADIAIANKDTDLVNTLMAHKGATQELVDKFMESPMKRQAMGQASPFLYKYVKEALRSDDLGERQNAMSHAYSLSKEDSIKEILENPHEDVASGILNYSNNLKAEDLVENSEVISKIQGMNKTVQNSFLNRLRNFSRSVTDHAKKDLIGKTVAEFTNKLFDPTSTDRYAMDNWIVNTSNFLANAPETAKYFEPFIERFTKESLPQNTRSNAVYYLGKYMSEPQLLAMSKHPDANAYGTYLMAQPNAPDSLIDSVAMNPLLDYYARETAIKHPKFKRHIELLKDKSRDVRRLAISSGGIPLDVLLEHAKTEPDFNIKESIKKAAIQQTPDDRYKRRVQVRMNTMKIRKLRDMLEEKPTKDVHVKEIAKIPGMGGNWDKFKDNKGRVSAAKLQEFLDKSPVDLEYNLSYARFNMKMTSNNEWDRPANMKPDGTPDWDRLIITQRHNNRASNVLQVNITNDMVNRVKAAGLYPQFERILRYKHSTWHPLQRGDPDPNTGHWDWNHTLGWVRWTGAPETGIFIDELQSDFGRDLDKMVERGELKKEHAKKLNELVYGGHHPSVVMGEVFMQWLRDKGHPETKVAIHGLDSKARISLPDYDPKNHPPPVHMKTAYNDAPPKIFAMEPSEYRESNMPTQNNPNFQGRQTWQGKVRKSEEELLMKYERGELMTAQEIASLEAILELCDMNRMNNG